MISNNLIAAASFTPNSLQSPNAWVGHLPFAAWVIQEVSPKIFVELGTHSGNSYFSFCQSVVEAGISSKCYAVDTWQGDEHAGQYGDEIFAKVNAHHQENYAGFSRLMRMTFDDGATYFADESIDLLHIDGLHTYEAVRHDFETWLPKLAPGAVVMFHDTNVRERNFGVWKLWEELQARYPNNLEFVHSHGLGVLQLDNAPDDKKLSWLQNHSPEKQQLIIYFAALGSRQLELCALGSQVAERDGQIGSLNQAVAERDGQIESLNQAVTERDGQIGSLNQAVTERDDQIANLSQAVAERDDQIASLKLTLIESDGEIARIITSRSWRITKPLRFFARFIRGFYTSVFLVFRKTINKSSVFRSTQRLTRLSRFVRNAFQAVRSELRHHGLAGFIYRAPYYSRNSRIIIARLTSCPPAAECKLFRAEAPSPSNFRLHPELAGIGEPITASVSVVIPTLNAGHEFRLLLRKLRAQRGFRELEIVVIDSGSLDGTVEIARAAGCNVVEIPPEDFSHSAARNKGADASYGEYLLFMVQDAYPIGDYWIYGMLRYLLDHVGDKLVAASCAEYSRSDSDMMYDSMINTHYRFLGCLEYDRIGSYQGNDHMSLRSYGQLSDVSCLIGRETFHCYRYRGDYAEDLDLGIRLIKDGYRVAMLASIKVIHSHNRSAYYYLKRSYVDVIFLVGLFDDFVYPKVKSSRGLILGIVSVAAHLSDWLAVIGEGGSDRTVQKEIAKWVQTWRHSFTKLQQGTRARLGDEQLDAYVDSLSDRYLPAGIVPARDEHQEAQRFTDAFLSRLEHFKDFAGGVYGAQDIGLRRELQNAVVKIFGATAGSALGFMRLGLLQAEAVECTMSETINIELRAGI